MQVQGPVSKRAEGAWEQRHGFVPSGPQGFYPLKDLHCSLIVTVSFVTFGGMWDAEEAGSLCFLVNMLFLVP